MNKSLYHCSPLVTIIQGLKYLTYLLEWQWHCKLKRKDPIKHSSRDKYSVSPLLVMFNCSPAISPCNLLCWDIAKYVDSANEKIQHQDIIENATLHNSNTVRERDKRKLIVPHFGRSLELGIVCLLTYTVDQNRTAT